MDFSILGNFFIIGITILVVAILMNALAYFLGVATWYQFIQSIGDNGPLEALKSQGSFSLLFLFFIYPLFLGVTGYYITNWLT